MESTRQAWLMKAEPEPRIVKDHEAKNLMKEKMKKGDHVLIYHSNCKVPGIAGVAEIDREGYPDFTAFDSSHPYYDPKSIKGKPTWYMVDVKFKSRLTNFIPLKLLQNLIKENTKLPDYLNSKDIEVIKEMALLKRGRLSVQPVSLEAFEVIQKLGSFSSTSPEVEPSASSKDTPSRSKKRKNSSEDKAVQNARKRRVKT